MGRSRAPKGHGQPLAKKLVLAILAGPVLLPLLFETNSQQVAAAVRSAALPNSTIDLAGLEQHFQAVAERVAPSVVAISAACDPIDADEVVRSEELNPQRLERRLSGITRTVGTGFVIAADGYIATNEHVVADCAQLWVTTDDRKVYPAIVVGSDPRADLAVLKIPARDLKPVTFATPDQVKRGQWTIALGNPYGMAMEGEMAMSVGVISATDRSLAKLSKTENRLYHNLIQTTAEINPGNSGGPLFNLAGEVVGINTAVVLPQKQTNGLGFAIPSTTATQTALAELQYGREIVYGYVGLVVSNATIRDRADAGIKGLIGARIDSIERGSPAARTALKVGDVITHFAGQEIINSDQFVRTVGHTPVDRVTELRVHRGGRSQTIELTPVARATETVAVNRHNQRLRWRGMVLGAVPDNWSHKSEKTVAARSGDAAPSGLIVIGLDDSSPYANSLSIGSIITSIGGKSVNTVADLQSLLDATRPEQIGEIRTLETTGAVVASTNE